MPDRPTALITGASSGIGVDIAEELAKRNHNLILTARRGELLEQVREGLRSRHDVEVDLIVCDLNDKEAPQKLFDQAIELGRPVAVLANNAGVGRFGPFLGQQLEDLEAMIQVNVSALTALTRLFAGEMKQRGGGRILNTASFSGLQPVPSYAVYSGTKAYVLAFSQAADRNMKRHNVQVSALAAGFFDSDFLDKSGQRESAILQLITMKRQMVARAAVRGLFRGQTVIVPGWIYRFNNAALRLLPRTTATSIANWLVTT